MNLQFIRKILVLGFLPLAFALFVVETIFAQDSNLNNSLGQNVENELLVKANWIPLSHSKYGFKEKWKTIANLSSNSNTKTYPLSSFDFFIPPDELKGTEIWEIKTENIIKVLKQFHSGATASLRNPETEGCFGCVVAENPQYQKVRIRLHMEFELSDGYYTPSCFIGESIVRKADKKVLAVKIFVPSKHYNVDLNWTTGKTISTKIFNHSGDERAKNYPEVIADIGHCEKMELCGGNWDMFHKTKWTTQLAIEKVDQSFKVKFYRFANINWLCWEDAVAKSKLTGKPLHVVAIFGVLDDESC